MRIQTDNKPTVSQFILIETPIFKHFFREQKTMSETSEVEAPAPADSFWEVGQFKVKSLFSFRLTIFVKNSAQYPASKMVKNSSLR